MRTERGAAPARWWAAGALAWLLAGLSACGGSSSGVEAPPAAERPELIGTVSPGYDDVSTESGGNVQNHDGRVVVSVRGATGIMRTSDSFGAGIAHQHRTGLSDLGAPYMLSDALIDGSFLTSVATGAGHANVTALTTLLVAQLLGSDPHTAFQAYGSAATATSARITDADIDDAQARVIAYLQGTLGVAVKSGSASFIEADFKAEPGDPMYDTMVALNAKLAATGSSLTALAASLAAEARRCLTEKLLVTAGTGAREFCPQAKSGTPDDADPTLLAYRIVDAAGDELLLHVRADSLLDARYTPAGGTVAACSGTACTGIALGPMATDLTRPIRFTAAAIGAVRFAGTLTLPTPGVAIPVLPCDDNKLALVLPDRSVDASCVDASDPLGIGAVLGGSVGLPRLGYTLGSSAMVLVENGTRIVSITALQPYTDPATGERVVFKCVRDECAGANFGPATINSDLGVDVTIRDFTMKDVQLHPLKADGTPAALAATASLQGQFTLIEYVDPSELNPPPNDCAGTSDRFDAKRSDQAAPFPICPTADNKRASVASDGTLALSVVGSVPVGSSPILTIGVQGGVATRIELVGVGLGFRCVADCQGVTIGLPDANGQRVVSFGGTLLREVDPADLPGERTVTLDGSYVAPAPTQ